LGASITCHVIPRGRKRSFGALQAPWKAKLEVLHDRLEIMNIVNARPCPKSDVHPADDASQARQLVEKPCGVRPGASQGRASLVGEFGVSAGRGVSVGGSVSVGMGAVASAAVGSSLGAAVGAPVSVSVGVLGTGVGVAVGTLVAVGSTVAVAVGVSSAGAVGLGSAVAVSVGSGLGEGETVDVEEGDGLGIAVTVGDGVSVAVTRGTRVGEMNSVGAVVAVGVGMGVGEPSCQRKITLAKPKQYMHDALMTATAAAMNSSLWRRLRRSYRSKSSFTTLLETYCVRD
jgi:hypothetical protein